MRGVIQTASGITLLLWLGACGSADTLQGAAPADVDPQLWAQLTAALEPYTRSASATDAPARLPRPSELTWHADTHELTWAYELAGDYNQDGEVTPADLVPLAQHFGTYASESGEVAFPYWSIEAVIDGDRNGQIGMSDLTVLGRNMGTKVERYAIYASREFRNYPLAELRQTYPVPKPGGFEGDYTGSATFIYERRYMTPAAERQADGADALLRTAPGLSSFSVEQRKSGRLELSYSFASYAPQWQTFWLRAESGAVAGGPSLPAMRPLPDTASPAPADWGLAYNSFSQRLTWYFYLRGSYDFNKEVNVSDLSPVITNWLDSGPWELPAANYGRDNDGDLLITHRDLRTIGMYWKHWLDGYLVQGSNDPAVLSGGNAGVVDIVTLDAAVDQQPWSFNLSTYPGIRPYYEASLAGFDPRYVWVRPIELQYVAGQGIVPVSGPRSAVIARW